MRGDGCEGGGGWWEADCIVTWLAGVVETPVDTVGPGVGLDHGSDKGKGSRGNDGGTEEHCESWSV